MNCPSYACTHSNNAIGRIRIRLDDASAASLIPFVKSTVSEGAGLYGRVVRLPSPFAWMNCPG